MKLCYIDVETGGLDPKRAALLQLSGILEAKDGQTEDFNFYICPFRDDIVDPKALEVNKLNPMVDERFIPAQEAYLGFLSVLDKYIDKYNKKDKLFFVGYNSHSFDMPFVRSFFEKNYNKYFGSYFWYPSIDVMLLAAAKLAPKREEFKDFKLKTVAQYFGLQVEEKELHSALYDVHLTRELYKLLMKC